MRKILILSVFVLAIVYLVTFIGFVTSDENEINIILNGNLIDVSNFEIKPYNSNGRIMVPLRLISEELNYSVEWRAKDQVIIIKENNNSNWYKIAYFKIGRKEVYAEKPFTMDIAPEIRSGRTVVPLRFVAEFFEKKVSWDSSTNSVILENTILPTPSPTPALEFKLQTYEDNGYKFEAVLKRFIGDTYTYTLKGLIPFTPNTQKDSSESVIGIFHDDNFENYIDEAIEVLSSKYKFNKNELKAFILTHNKENFNLQKDLYLSNSKNVISVRSNDNFNVSIYVLKR